MALGKFDVFVIQSDRAVTTRVFKPILDWTGLIPARAASLAYWISFACISAECVDLYEHGYFPSWFEIVIWGPVFGYIAVQFFFRRSEFESKKRAFKGPEGAASRLAIVAMSVGVAMMFGYLSYQGFSTWYGCLLLTSMFVCLVFAVQFSACASAPAEVDDLIATFDTQV